jgi:hypothetical protein
MVDTGFLAPWLTDLGSAVGLVTGLFAVFKAFMDDRPFSYLEPDQLEGTLKLFVVNGGRRSIVIKTTYIRPAGRWYIAPNALPLTDEGRQHSRYGKPETVCTNWNNQNVIVEPGKTHELFLRSHNRDAEPRCCFVLISWQPLGGLPINRLPVLIYQNKVEIEHLFRARKGKHE